jgi:hypothetical protein
MTHAEQAERIRYLEHVSQCQYRALRALEEDLARLREPARVVYKCPAPTPTLDPVNEASAAQFRASGGGVETRPPPALSPRQALGEALACVERARDLLKRVASVPADAMPFEARHAAWQAFDSVRNAWCCLGTSRALLDVHEAVK